MASPLQIFAGFRPPQRRALKVQLPLVLATSVLLSLGYHGELEWLRFADERHIPLLVDRWDGLAWFVWLGAAPVMLVLVQRFPLSRGELCRNLTGLTLGSLLLYLVVANVRFCLRVLPHLGTNGNPADFANYLNATLALLPIDFVSYCGFLAITVAVDYNLRLREQADAAVQLQVKAAQLQSDLSRAELAALRNQLHPHFLFNSFNAVATLVRQKKNDCAVEVITQLSALLRRALDRTGRASISLEEEMDFIRRYLEIEKVRFGDKLQFDFSIDPASLGALVPNLVLQPLVENAIKHGIAQRTAPGSVSIIAARKDNRLEIEIANDGPDEPAAADDERNGESSRIGVANTRLRLEKLYGTNYRFEMKTRERGGMVVHLNLPWQPAPGPLETVAP